MSSTSPKCPVCSKAVYLAEGVAFNGSSYHKKCMRCSAETCKKQLVPAQCFLHGVWSLLPRLSLPSRPFSDAFFQGKIFCTAHGRAAASYSAAYSLSKSTATAGEPAPSASGSATPPPKPHVNVPAALKAAVPVEKPITPVEPKKEDDDRIEVFKSSGAVITDVVLVSPLGEGNFGTVFRASWKGCEVAAKRTKGVLGKREFLDEAEMCLKVRHPHCVQFFGVFVKEDSIFLVSELMMCSLQKLIITRCFTDFELIGFSRDTAAGMAYLSSQNIVHRDLALRNLLVKEESGGKLLVKVADFGLSRSLRSEGTYSGSNSSMPIRWSSPESLKSRVFSSKSDVWSFAVTLFELFSRGELPYLGSTNEEVTDGVITGSKKLQAPNGTPPEITDLMRRCFEREPDARPTFDTILGLLTATLRDVPEESSAPQIASVYSGPSASTSGAPPAEPTSKCVQCGAAYKESENPDNCCTFHTLPPGDGGKNSCCNKHSPCSSARHRAVHHIDYPYESFHPWAEKNRFSAPKQLLYIREESLALRDHEAETTTEAFCGLLVDGKIFFSLRENSRFLFAAEFDKDAVGKLCSCAPGLEERLEVWKRTSYAPDTAAFSAHWLVRTGALVGVSMMLHLPSVGTLVEKVMEMTIEFKGFAPTREVIARDERHPSVFLPTGSSRYPLAPPVAAGPTAAPTTQKITEHKSTGTLFLRKFRPTISTQSFAGHGSFTNFFTNGLDVINLGSERIAILEIKSMAILTPGGDWTPIPEQEISGKDIFGPQPPKFKPGTTIMVPGEVFEPLALPIVLEPGKSLKIFVRTFVEITGEPIGETWQRNRAHYTLPQPFQIKIVFVDTSGSDSSIICEQLNPPTALATREEAEKHARCKSLLQFLTVDDVRVPSREWLAMYVSEDVELTLMTFKNTMTLPHRVITRYTIAAARDKRSEIAIPWPEPKFAKITLLVDPDQRIAYGLRISLATETSSLVAEVPLPDIASLFESTSLKASSIEVNPGTPIRIDWSYPVIPGKFQICLCSWISPRGDTLRCTLVSDTTSGEGFVTFTAPETPGTYKFILINSRSQDPMATSNFINVVTSLIVH